MNARAGWLDKRCTVQGVRRVRDAQGGWTDVWETLYSRSCRLRAVSSEQAISAGRPEMVGLYQIELRGAPLTQEHRLLIDETVFSIESVTGDVRGRHTVLLARASGTAPARSSTTGTAPVRAGKLSERIRIEAPAEVRGYGGQVVWDWSSLGDYSAEIRQVSSSEAVRAGRPEMLGLTRVIIREHEITGLNSKCRILWAGRLLNIESIAREGRVITFVCKDVGPLFEALSIQGQIISIAGEPLAPPGVVQ